MQQEAFRSFYPLPAPSAADSLDAESVLAYLNEVLSNHLASNGPKLENADSADWGDQRGPAKSEGDRKDPRLALDHWIAQAYAERRLRDKVFNDPEMFGEPAWDTLLDIARAEARGERLAVTSACIGSCVPPTTALRWLKILEERDLVRREADDFDARRSFVRLTKEGRKKVETYFEEVKRLRCS